MKGFHLQTRPWHSLPASIAVGAVWIFLRDTDYALLLKWVSCVGAGFAVAMLLAINRKEEP